MKKMTRNARATCDRAVLPLSHDVLRPRAQSSNRFGELQRVIGPEPGSWLCPTALNKVTTSDFSRTTHMLVYDSRMSVDDEQACKESFFACSHSPNHKRLDASPTACPVAAADQGLRLQIIYLTIEGSA